LPNADWPLPNVWLGVTAENQARADERIPILLKTPAALRFVSCEPMLAEINLGSHTPIGGFWRNYLSGEARVWDVGDCITERTNRIDWVICGGETGPHARPFNPDWARRLRDQCESAGVPFFMKQGGKIKYADLPADLQVRQWPKNRGSTKYDRDNCPQCR
jgi:protein gp37